MRAWLAVIALVACKDKPAPPVGAPIVVEAGVLAAGNPPARLDEHAPITQTGPFDDRAPPAEPDELDDVVEPLPLDGVSPRRGARVAGRVAEDGKLAARAVLVVPGATPAAKVIELVASTPAAIGVDHERTLRSLRIELARTPHTARGWIEARLSATTVTIEGVPDVPIELATFEVRPLRDAIAKTRSDRGFPADAPVDVLVDAGVNTQRLVDLLVALDLAGVRELGLGTQLSPGELKLRGKRPPATVFTKLHVESEADRADIQSVLTAARPKLHACYATALATSPALAGTVTTLFLVRRDGKVASPTAVADGIPPSVASCVANVTGQLVFAAPKNLVQALYTLTMHP